MSMRDGNLPDEVGLFNLTAIQGLVLSVLLNPSPMFELKGDDGKELYRSLGRSNIAAYLGVSYGEVVESFDENLIKALDHACFANLRTHRAMVDAALMQAATIASNFGTPDRKLYYTLIGDIGKRSEKPGKAQPAENRDERAKRIWQYLSIVARRPIEKETFDAGGPHDPGNDGTGKGSVPREKT